MQNAIKKVIIALIAFACIAVIAGTIESLGNTEGYRVREYDDDAGEYVRQVDGQGVKVFIALIACAALVGTAASLLVKSQRRYTLLFLLAGILILAGYRVIAGDAQYKSVRPVTNQNQGPPEEKLKKDERQLIKPDELNPEDIPSGAVFLLTLALLGGGGYIAYRYWRGYEDRKARAALRAFSKTAGQLHDSLASGSVSYPDAVTECFAAMQTLAAASLGLKRPPSMTPVEYARAIAARGAPEQAALTIAELYGQVRYGESAPDASDAARAKAALAQLATLAQARSTAA